VPSAEAASLMQAALAGETDTAKLFYFTPAGNYVAVAPIRTSQKQVAGLLILTATLPGGVTGIYQQIVNNMGRFLIFATLLAGVIGTGIGFLTVWGLTRRLRAIARNASAWGQGNFSKLNTDNSGDEIGELARQMNQVARQLQSLLDTQQALAAVDERNRLARDLHDTVKQQIFATTMQLGAASALIDNDPGTAKTHLEEAQKLAHNARDELGVLIHELRPVALDGRSFAQALRDYATDWSRQTRITATIQVQGEGTLNAPGEQALLRVAQEALSNVARHSRATHVEIDLTYGNPLTLKITDNGQGFDPATVEKGVGLDSMRERLKALGGTATVESTLTVGTTITATLPKA
jgi:NarL family two-component system sensor histidine kinase LiaS